MGTHFESILSSGAFAVVVFFGLSGIALRFQTDKFGLSFRWLAARFIRLIPVYWVTFLLPFFGFYLLGVHFSYSWYGFVISVFGLQALFHNIAVPPANGPLWSLSVEIYLSASLVVIGFWRRQSGFLCLLTLILAAVLFPKNLILQGLPIFYFGYLLPSI